MGTQEVDRHSWHTTTYDHHHARDGDRQTNSRDYHTVQVTSLVSWPVTYVPWHLHNHDIYHMHTTPQCSQIHTHRGTHTHTETHTHTDTHTNTDTHTHRQTHVHTCTHTHRQTHTRAHTHRQTCPFPLCIRMGIMPKLCNKCIIIIDHIIRT